jgi:hypothetical protein
MDSEFQVKTHIFEGPLDTLLSLIEKRKLFINDISLAQVADDYISYVKSLNDFPIADSAHFILIASTLVLIKSKSLLPTLTLSEEEESSIEDLESYDRSSYCFKELMNKLVKYVNVNDKNDCFVIAGYIVAFDIGFINIECIIIEHIYESLLHHQMKGMPWHAHHDRIMLRLFISKHLCIVNLKGECNSPLRVRCRSFQHWIYINHISKMKGMPWHAPTTHY